MSLLLSLSLSLSLCPIKIWTGHREDQGAILQTFSHRSGKTAVNYALSICYQRCDASWLPALPETGPHRHRLLLLRHLRHQKRTSYTHKLPSLYQIFKDLRSPIFHLLSNPFISPLFVHGRFNRRCWTTDWDRLGLGLGLGLRFYLHTDWPIASLIVSLHLIPSTLDYPSPPRLDTPLLGATNTRLPGGRRYRCVT